uniref:Uncharacterized protein n=1 Tax=Heterorhabditis bacteriophora TaxID=37862 RepID=A0A1I7WDM8_HETBA
MDPYEFVIPLLCETLVTEAYELTTQDVSIGLYLKAKQQTKSAIHWDELLHRAVQLVLSQIYANHLLNQAYIPMSSNLNCNIILNTTLVNSNYNSSTCGRVLFYPVTRVLC